MTLTIKNQEHYSMSIQNSKNTLQPLYLIQKNEAFLKRGYRSNVINL